MVSSYGGCIFWGIFFFFFWGVLVCFALFFFFPPVFGLLGLGLFCLFLTIYHNGFHFYKSLPTVELSSSTTSTFLSLYSTLKSSIRGCLSTICLDGTTWRNAEDEEGVEEAAVEWLVGPYAGPCKVSPPYSLKDRQIRKFKQNSLICFN